MKKSKPRQKFPRRLTLVEKKAIYQKHMKKGDLSRISEITGYSKDSVSQILKGSVIVGEVINRAYTMACLRINEDLNKKRAVFYYHKERGDITLVSRLTGFAVSTVSDVLRGVYDNEEIVEAAYRLVVDLNGAPKSVVFFPHHAIRKAFDGELDEIIWSTTEKTRTKKSKPVNKSKPIKKSKPKKTVLYKKIFL